MKVLRAFIVKGPPSSGAPVPQHVSHGGGVQQRHGEVVRGQRSEPGLHPHHPRAAEDRPDAGPARRPGVCVLCAWLAELGGLPVLPGGGPVVPGGPLRLPPHAPAATAEEDALHQLASDGILPLRRGQRAPLHRLHRRRCEVCRSLGAGGCSGVWVPGHLPDGGEPVDVVQRGLRPSGWFLGVK